MGLRRDRSRPRARGPRQRGHAAPHQAGRHREDADHGRLPAVLGPRPRGHVRPRPRRQARLSDLLPVALRAARAGAAVLRESGLPQPGFAAELKAKGDYVTDVDRRSESAILEVLAREAPGIAVLAEERGGVQAPTMWAVDPLDGTTNFMRGFPSVGISVALVDSGQPLVGVVLAPYLGAEFTASRGNGAFLNDERLPQHRGIDPSGAVVATGFPFRNKSLLPRYLSMFGLAIERFEDLRRAGAAALDLAWTASSTFDGFFELSLNTWDVAAGALLVLEVGGRVTDWSGGDTWLQSGNILAAAPAVHDVLLELAAKSHER
ncbi:MAG: inositol monophosphatase [Chloroflexi bacterium]|nr:MAG: inositol monophosphatase [Chloroflexota bacterium]